MAVQHENDRKYHFLPRSDYEIENHRTLSESYLANFYFPLEVIESKYLDVLVAVLLTFLSTLPARDC